jgi:hypothetical protein
MSDLESLLRRDLERRAATAPVPDGPPGDLVARVARRRRSHVRACIAAASLVVGLLALPAVLDVRGDGGTDVAAGGDDAAGALPAIPPALSGSVVASVETNPCDNTPGRECVSAVVRFSIGSSDALDTVDTDDWSRVTVLPDGRYVARDGSRPELWVLVDPRGTPPLPLGRDVQSVDVLPDGRLIMLATGDDGRAVIRTLDGRTRATQDRDVPAEVRGATAVTGGPDGAVAVVGKGGACCALRDLVVIDADGRTRHHRLSMPDRSTPFSPAVSWGPAGLLAITDQRPDPIVAVVHENRRAPERDDLHPGWTDVYDVHSGDLVVSLDGWQGLAWAPDGRGLLTAQREGERASQLAVWWGPGLERRLDLGRTPLPVMPRYWSAG